MNVAYLGPLRDYSGYGEANRHFVGALDAVGVHVIPQLVSYVGERSDFGDLGKRIDLLIKDRSHDKYDIKILHTTPDEYKRLMEPDTYHIGHFFWETDRIPQDFTKAFSLVDEVWTGSEANKSAILSTGVDKPVYIFPQPIETNRDYGDPYEVPGFPEDGYMFYSVFEWTDRKNPEALIKAYYREFQNGENVGLLLKTYFRNFTLTNKRMIRSKISKIKSELGFKSYPPIFLYLDLMDRSQINRLHKTADCYVSAHRGEGWGVPQVEAMLAGNLVISTGYGGVHEYLDKSSAILLPYEMVPLTGMQHSSNWYTGEQKWADVDKKVLREAMRWALDNPSSADLIAKGGTALVREEFNFEHVGKLMATRLAEIEEGL